MTELVDPTDQDGMIGQMTTDIVDQKQLAEQLLEQAKEQNIELVGPGGLLNQASIAMRRPDCQMPPDPLASARAER